MKINQEKIDLVVDLMLNQILGECKGFKECNTKIAEDEELNEMDELEEDLENVDEQIASKGMMLAKQNAMKLAKVRQAANAGANMAARGGNASARTAAVLRT